MCVDVVSGMTRADSDGSWNTCKDSTPVVVDAAPHGYLISPVMSSYPAITDHPRPGTARCPWLLQVRSVVVSFSLSSNKHNSYSICTNYIYIFFLFIVIIILILCARLRLSYYYFRFGKTYGRHIRILLPVSILTYSSSLAWQIASIYQILSKLVNSRRSYDVINFSRWRPWRRKSISGCMFGDGTRLRSQYLSAYQILMRYLNPRLSYYYVRFTKINGRYLGIVLPVCNLIMYSLIPHIPKVNYSLTETLDYDIRFALAGAGGSADKRDTDGLHTNGQVTGTIGCSCCCWAAW